MAEHSRRGGYALREIQMNRYITKDQQYEDAIRKNGTVAHLSSNSDMEARVSESKAI